jgi:hypothetical protein
MSNTISLELKAKRQQQEKYRKIIEEWILQHESLFTHAVTLTFNHTKLRRQIMNIDPAICLNSDRMIDLYKDSMRSFKWKLVKSLYGNSWQRFNRPFVFIPISEGLGRNEKPHYHCILGVEAEKSGMVYETVRSIWNTMPFGGCRVDVQPYISVGWVRYTTKNALLINRESIDWDNVLLPQHRSLVE